MRGSARGGISYSARRTSTEGRTCKHHLPEPPDGPVSGEIWRIGCMGHTARERNVTLLLGALDEILR